MKRRRGLILVALLLLLAACSQKTDLNAPPELVLGQDVCDECTMIINEARFAASYVTNKGDVRRFDDIGGMLAYTQRANEDVHKFWVHDFHSEEWLDAEKATFVFNPGLMTPMGWSVAAFGEVAEAEAYVGDFGGTTTTFEAILESVVSGAIDPSSLESSGEHNMEQMEGMEESGSTGG